MKKFTWALVALLMVPGLVHADASHQTRARQKTPQQYKRYFNKMITRLIKPSAHATAYTLGGRLGFRKLGVKLDVGVARTSVGGKDTFQVVFAPGWLGTTKWIASVIGTSSHYVAPARTKARDVIPLIERRIGFAGGLVGAFEEDGKRRSIHTGYGLGFGAGFPMMDLGVQPPLPFFTQKSVMLKIAERGLRVATRAQQAEQRGDNTTRDANLSVLNTLRAELRKTVQARPNVRNLGEQEKIVTDMVQFQHRSLPGEVM
ncbi:MAG: hypothetical protein JRH20_30650 [Deltaproteobacteria bacterium]|nr:hypothetical protein [Deltaproteobacteria bacterium]